MTICGVNMFSLHNRLALVTGGGRGIGRAIAIGLAQAGAKVAVTARTAAELEEVVQTINKSGSKALAIVSDLTQEGAPAQALEKMTKQLGPVDILVNNAGIGSSANPKPVIEFDDDFWNLTLLLNLTV